MADEKALRLIGLVYGAVTMAIATIAVFTTTADNSIQVASDLSPNSQQIP